MTQCNVHSLHHVLHTCTWCLHLLAAMWTLAVFNTCYYQHHNKLIIPTHPTLIKPTSCSFTRIVYTEFRKCMLVFLQYKKFPSGYIYGDLDTAITEGIYLLMTHALSLKFTQLMLVAYSYCFCVDNLTDYYLWCTTNSKVYTGYWFLPLKPLHYNWVRCTNSTALERHTP